MYYVRTETVLRQAMQALVRVQAHMLLARIVVEIRAADICRVGTVGYRDVFDAADNAHEFPRCT